MATYDELIAQPQAFMHTLQSVQPTLQTIAKALKGRTIDTVILTGCGDSWFVGNSVQYAIEALTNFRCLSLEAYEFEMYYHNGINDRCIVIGQSASGTTQTVLRGLSHAKACGAVSIGMGNTEHSTILAEYDYGIYVPVTRKGWPTQATTSAIGVLIALFCQIAQEKGLNVSLVENLTKELDTIPALMSQAIEQNEQSIKAFCKSRVDEVFFQATGAGPSYAVAQIAAAKLKELCPVHAYAYPLEEFHHYRALKPNDTLILIAPQETCKMRELDTALVGAYDEGVIVTVANEAPSELLKVTDLFCQVPKVSEYLGPLVYSVPVHLFAYYVALAKFEASVGYPSSKR